MSTKAIINNTFVFNRDSSSTFPSPVTTLDEPLQSLNFQLFWEAGVLGAFQFQTDIKSGEWEQLLDCNKRPVQVIAGGTEANEIVSLINPWQAFNAVRFVWVPQSSSGLINCTLRVVPT